MDIVRTCAVTGHRPQSLPWKFDENHEDCLRLKGVLREQVENLAEKYVFRYLSGMALGIDTYFSEIVLELKKERPLNLECIIPYEGQADNWTEEQRNRYFSIIEKSYKAHHLQTHYTEDCFKKRNQWLVDHSDILIAVWNGKNSGTSMTVRYAKQKGKKVIIINPITFEVTTE